MKAGCTPPGRTRLCRFSPLHAMMMMMMMFINIVHLNLTGLTVISERPGKSKRSFMERNEMSLSVGLSCCLTEVGLCICDSLWSPV